MWYAGRPLPLFSVRLDAANGGGAVPDGIRLRSSFLNGRGVIEETNTNGMIALVAGERYAYVVGGRAVWERLVVSEASTPPPSTTAASQSASMPSRSRTLPRG
jgi:hypothetical protein